MNLIPRREQRYGLESYELQIVGVQKSCLKSRESLTWSAFWNCVRSTFFGDDF